MINEYLSHIPLSYAEHAHLGWRLSQQQVLRSRYTWLPISLSELARTSAYFPVVIIQQGQRWSMVVLLDDSLELQANCIVPKRRKVSFNLCAYRRIRFR